MAVKSQKVGLTTTTLMEDFQDIITSGNGKDLLVIAQSDRHALEHINTLKRLIASSNKYRKYLITRSKELYFKEEKTKLGTIYLKNPLNAFRPSRIIGLPFSEGAIWSWKQVFKIHLSDPAAADVVDDSGIYAAAESRVANTNGDIVIEGPPRGPKGKFYEYYEKFKDNHDPDFYIQIITAQDGVKCGLISDEFLDEQKVKLGPLYYQYYGASFLANVGNVFTEDQLRRMSHLGKIYQKVGPIPGTIKTIGCDPTYGGNSSSFAFVVTQAIDNGHKIQVLHSKKFGGKGQEAPDLEDMENYLIKLAVKYDIFGYRSSPHLTIDKDVFFGQIIIDSSNQFFIQNIKKQVDSREYNDYMVLKRMNKEENPEFSIQYLRGAINNKRFQEMRKQHKIQVQKVIPVSFASESIDMQFKLQFLGTTDKLIIDESEHKELFNELRIAQQDADGRLLKPNIARVPNAPTYDLIDALKLSLYPYDVVQ